MSGLRKSQVKDITPTRDAFGRFRVSAPETIFDSKLSTANTVTEGTTVAGGFVQGSETAATVVESLYYLGATIGGTVDTMVLCVRPLSANEDIHASLTVKEIA